MKKVIYERDYKKDFGEQEYKCGECESVFITDEYSVRKENVRTGDNKYKFGHGEEEMCPSYVLKADCPTCGDILSKIIPTGEKRFWQWFPYP